MTIYILSETWVGFTVTASQTALTVALHYYPAITTRSHRHIPDPSEDTKVLIADLSEDTKGLIPEFSR